MPLPATQLFESFLSRTRLSREKPETPAVEFSGKSRGYSEAPILYLAYPETELKLESLLSRIASELRSTGSVADEKIALAALGLISESHTDGMSWVEHANRCIARTHDATLHQIIVLPSAPPRDYRITRAAYSLRKFDPEQLLYWAKRGGSSYPIDLHDLAGRLCIAREPQTTRLIHWDEVSGCEQIVQRWGTRVTLQSIMDVYYQAVSEHHLSNLPEQIKDDLVIYEAGALMNVAVDELLGLLFGFRIGLFHWKGGSGHRSWAVLASQSVLHTNLHPMALFRECTAWLENELGYRELSEARPLDATVRTYSRFLQRAHDHRLNGRLDESLLHFVIALDLLLGLEGRSSESVCQRAALLVYRQLGNTFGAQFSALRRLYDRRSKYVHEGKKILETDALEAERVCTEILWNLLAASNLNRFQSIDEWLRQIDYLVATIKASRELSVDDLKGIGLPSANHARKPPNRVERL